MKKILPLVLVFCMLLSMSGCTKTRITESLDDYLQPAVPMIETEFLLFPVRSALEECTVNKYRSESVSTLLFDDVYILLSCTYTRQQYDDEIARFEGIGAYYREDLFRFPAYVAAFLGKSYEYALLDEEKLTVTYIAAYTTDFYTETDKMMKSFPAQFAPLKTDGVELRIYDYGITKGEITVGGSRYSFFQHADDWTLKGVPASTASRKQLTAVLEPCNISISDCGEISSALAAAYYGANALQQRTPNWTAADSIGVVYNEKAEVWIVHGQFQDRSDPGEAWAVVLDAASGQVLGFAALSTTEGEPSFESA